MIDTKEKVQLLLEQGEAFTYQNFASKSEYGYPAALTPDFVAWKSRVIGTIRTLLGRESAPAEMLDAGLGVVVIGNGPDKFEQLKSHLLGSLAAAKDVLSQDVFGELVDGSAVAPVSYSNRVFIVHGHNEAAKNELEILLREIGLEPIVLHRRPDEGLTVIEKFEKHGDVGYVFVLLTPDEIAYLASNETLPDSERIKERRARPNVLFELGYFVGRLGRSRVCCIHTGDVVLPTDITGLLYKSYRVSLHEIAYDVMKELKAAGFSRLGIG